MSVQVEFHPKLKDSSVDEEAKRLAEEMLLEEQRQRELSLAETQQDNDTAASPIPTGVSNIHLSCLPACPQ